MWDSDWHENWQGKIKSGSPTAFPIDLSLLRDRGVEEFTALTEDSRVLL